MTSVSAASVAANDEGIGGLPPSLLEALGELAGAAKEGLLALSVGLVWGCSTARHADPRTEKVKLAGALELLLGGLAWVAGD